MLLGIAMTDARAYIIPDEFSSAGWSLGLLFALAGRVASGLGTALLGAAVGFGLLWVVGGRRASGSSSRRRWAAATSR